MKSDNLASIKEKFKSIRAHEQAWAYYLVKSFRPQRPISVWEVLMPIFLIFNYARAKADRDTFVQNVLYTKELALKAARDMVIKGLTKDAAMAPIDEKTRALLESVPEGIYSELIRQKQLLEMDLLIDHYCRLFQADGSDFDSLVLRAYTDRAEYAAFIDRLKAAEHDVNVASLQTVGPRGEPEFVSKLEDSTHTFRMATADRIFGQRE